MPFFTTVQGPFRFSAMVESALAEGTQRIINGPDWKVSGIMMRADLTHWEGVSYDLSVVLRYATHDIHVGVVRLIYTGRPVVMVAVPYDVPIDLGKIFGKPVSRINAASVSYVILKDQQVNDGLYFFASDVYVRLDNAILAAGLYNPRIR